MSVKVLSGQFKGSVLSVPDSARPTLVRSRQSLFDTLAGLAGVVFDSQKNSKKYPVSTLSNLVEEDSAKNFAEGSADPRNFFKNKTVLDCFAGSGALGIESLSRGASFAYFVDMSQAAICAIHENIKKLRLENHCRIIKTDIFKIRKFSSISTHDREISGCDIVFIDPPYGKVSIKKTLQRLSEKGWIDESSLVVTEEDISKTENLSDTTELIIERKLGKSVFKIMKPKID